MTTPRHSLVRVKPAALRNALARTSHRSDLLDAWVRQGWPAVRRRRCPADPAGHVPLGLPLPPACGKARVAIGVAPEHVLDVAPPPTLREAAAGAPAPWRETIARLLRLADDVQVTPRVFGSFAWQHITGLAYVGDASDLDLLWRLPERPEALLAGLTAIERDAPAAIDGEIVRPSDHGAVHWRELRDGAETVLVKGADAVALEPRQRFLAMVDA